MDARILPLASRRSVRNYTDAPVADADIQALLEAAMAAPSARATDPWHFIIVRDRPALADLAQILPYGQMLAHAPLGIIVCGELARANRQQLSYLLQDCSAATQNLLLAADLIGLGAVWLGVHPNEERVDGIRQRFDLPEGILPIAAIAIGHPAEKHAPRTRFTSAAVHHETWR